MYYISDVGVLCEKGVWIGGGELFELHRALVLEENNRTDTRHTEFLPQRSTVYFVFEKCSSMSTAIAGNSRTSCSTMSVMIDCSRGRKSGNLSLSESSKRGPKLLLCTMKHMVCWIINIINIRRRETKNSYLVDIIPLHYLPAFRIDIYIPNILS